MSEEKKLPPSGHPGGNHEQLSSQPKGTSDGSAPASSSEAPDLSFTEGLDMMGSPLFRLAYRPGPDELKDKWHIPPRWQKSTAAGNGAVLAAMRAQDAVGMVCGVVYDVIDYDPRNDPGGETLARLRSTNIIPKPDFVVATPGGGWHMYVPTLHMASGKPYPGLDYQGRGTFVLAPGTSGYNVLPREEWPRLGTMPEDARERFSALVYKAPARAKGYTPEDLSAEPTDAERAMAAGGLKKAARVVREAVSGTRNSTLYSEAVWLANYSAGGCLDWDEVVSTLTDAALDAGLEPGETHGTLESAWEKGSEDPRRPREDLGFEALPPEEQAEMVDAVFDSTPVLQHVRQAAHARTTSSLSVLGALLAMVVSRIPVPHVLPPIIGSEASLNFAVALVAFSGGGKSTSIGVAAELLNDTAKPPVCPAGVGSGEGLIQTFLMSQKDPITKKTVNVPKGYPHTLLVIDEIERLGRVQARTGATMDATLRTALTGGSLSTSNAEAERNRAVPAMSYRLAAMAGVQPAKADVLLNDASGGTPQRWLWLPTEDRSTPHPERKPDWPGALSWEPSLELDRHVVGVPEAIQKELQVRQWMIVQGKVKAGLDSHAGLTRLKVAAALAYLHGQRDITFQWWNIAGELMEISNGVRTSCTVAVAAHHANSNRAAGKNDASRAEAASESLAEKRIGMAKSVRKRCQTHAEPGKATHKAEGCTRSCFTNVLQRHTSDAVDAAIQEAESRGWVEKRGDRWFPGDTEDTDTTNPKEN